MKQGKSNARGSNGSRRVKTPAVICLPQAIPPVTPPRKEPEALRALSLPPAREQHILPNLPRLALKQRRKVKASTPAEVPAEVGALPRNLALVVQPKGLLAVGQWLRQWVMQPKKAALSIDRASAKTLVRALRVEVAQLQRSLDQLMAQLKGAERG